MTLDDLLTLRVENPQRSDASLCDDLTEEARAQFRQELIRRVSFRPGCEPTSREASVWEALGGTPEDMAA